MSEWKFDEGEAKPALAAAFEGMTRSGKTFGALRFAKGLVGGDMSKVALIDLEGTRSVPYLKSKLVGGFKRIPFKAPYSSERATEAIDWAVAQGVKVIIFDSMSLLHEGEGGLLEQFEQEKERIAQKTSEAAAERQKYTIPKIQYKRMLLHATTLPIHFIATFRQNEVQDQKTNKPVIKTIAEKSTLYEFELQVEFADKKMSKVKDPEYFAGILNAGDVITEEHGSAMANRFTPNCPEATERLENLQEPVEAGWDQNERITELVESLDLGPSQCKTTALWASNNLSEDLWNLDSEQGAKAIRGLEKKLNEQRATAS